MKIGGGGTTETKSPDSEFRILGLGRNRNDTESESELGEVGPKIGRNAISIKNQKTLESELHEISPPKSEEMQ
jgi:hypothetical protein